MNLLGYSCLSVCGQGPEIFWKSLYEGKVDLSEDRVFRITNQNQTSSKEKLGNQLLKIFSDIRLQRGKEDFVKDLGIILASTKGNIEDVIWSADRKALETDTLYPVLEYFLEKSELTPTLSTCISNACASSHGALCLAKLWLDSKAVKHVLVLAVDEIGSFIYQGFKSLGALSLSSAKPFSEKRDGLSLGEAAAGVLLSLEGKSDFIVDAIAIETEGHSITRPSTDGKKLEALVNAVTLSKPVQAVVAHGTATKFNDLTEDKVFSTLFSKVPVTATKWCIGHTLGTSGLMDLIASIGILKFQSVFKISTTEKIDSSFSANYVVSDCIKESAIQRILVTSLGFGGMQAAMTVARVGM